MTAPSPRLLPLTCPSCGASLKVAEGANRYTCGYCGNEHLLVTPAPYAPYAPETAAAVASAVAASTAEAAAAALAAESALAAEAARTSFPRAFARPRVPQPDSVSVDGDGQCARIIQRWFSWKFVPMAFFAVFWDGFLCFWYSMALSGGAPAAMILFPMIHLAVGVGITYYTLCGFLNHTTVELTREELSVRHSPLPWPGAKTINTAQIKQLYCKETISSGRRGTSYHYQLCAVTQNDREVKLVTNLDSPDVARFFEQQLETWLKIEDQIVIGEMG